MNTDKKFKIRKVVDAEDMMIEHGVPIPPRSRGGRYAPLAKKMSVGDSVVVKELKDMYALRREMIRLGKGITMRKVEDGIRVWAVDRKRG